ncbi:MAG TPA: MFS transporter [Candidatus Paceibacterota bacterium]|nr:MFS transporter [Candidatus Paceibacterota bacterium]
MIKKTIRTYLFLSVAHKFAISTHYAMYVIFLKSQGMNLLQINLVNLGFFLTIFLFEIPTGAFADVFGKKKSFVLSCFLWSLSFFVYGYSKSFIGFFAAESIAAIGKTFSSGAFEAWVINRLNRFNYNGELDKLFAKEEYLGRGFGIIGAFIGAWISDISMVWVWYIGGFLFFLVGIVSILIMEEENHREEELSIKSGFRSMAKNIKVSIRYGVKNKTIRFIILMVLIQFFFVQGFNMQWSIYFSRFFGPIRKLGFIWTGISLSLILGSFIAPYLLRKVGSNKKMLMIPLVISGIFIILATLFGPYLAILFFFLHEVGRGIFTPIRKSYINECIDSDDKRATINSFGSIVHHVGGGFGLVVSGIIAKSYSIEVNWLVMGSLLVIFSIAAYLWNRNSKPVSRK